jgi:hypothetical protein
VTTRRGWPRRLLREEHGFGPGSLTRIILWFAVLGVVGHDVGQMVWTQVQVSDAAHKSALAAANVYYQYKNPARAEQEAVQTATAVNNGIELKEFRVDVDGSVWTKASESATTFIFGRVGFLKGFTSRHATAHEERSPF